MEDKQPDVLREAERIARVAETKHLLKEAAIELNKSTPDGEIITREQVEAAQKNTERIAELQRSPKGLCRVIGVDRYDNENWLEGEYPTPEEAVRVAEEKTNEAKKCASDASIATIYYAYDSEGNYLGGDTWRQREKGGLVLTDEEESLVGLLEKSSLLGLQCKRVANPLPGSRQDIPWFQHPTLPDVFLSIIEGIPWWYFKRNDGNLKVVYIDFNTPKDEVKKFVDDNSRG